MTYLVVAFIGAVILQLLAFAIYTRINRVDIVDVAWGLSAVAIIASLHIYGSGFTTTVLIVDMLIIAWGARLSWHIAKRLKKSDKQDPRYTAIMQKWPDKHVKIQALFKIFVFQAGLATLVSLPVIVIHYYQPSLETIVIFGILVWVAGFIIEAVADSQLKKFLQTATRGKIMTEGIWRYSRHPNYFGEVTMWWGIAIMTFPTPLWWAGLLGAATITVLIYFISGVPLAEKRMENKDNWKEYKRRTSIFIPLPPKA